MQLTKEPTKIQKMFSEVAANYDRTNTILSLGIHHRWKNYLVKRVAAQNPRSILDCATGTGDVAIQMKKRLPSADVTGVDFCKEMVDRAPGKAKAAGVSIDFQVQDITRLNFPDSSFDAVTISFGIRNVENTAQGIAEMVRVLRPGGSLYILEFGRPRPEPFAHLYDFYAKKCLPKIGGLFSGQRLAYEYLQQSSAEFPAGQKFVDQYLKIPGLENSTSAPLSWGISVLYSARKQSLN